MTIEIPGMPIALKRPRYGDGKVYDSQTRDKGIVRILMRAKCSKTISCYLSVKMTFCFGSRESLDLWNINRPTQKDIDNICKFYLDCGNGILWKDDRQIVKIEAVKKYSKKSCTLIDITPIHDMKKSHEKLFSIMSPEELSAFRHDFLSILSEWNLSDIIKSSETEEFEQLTPIAYGLTALTKRWYDKFKKINAIKEE